MATQSIEVQRSLLITKVVLLNQLVYSKQRSLQTSTEMRADELTLCYSFSDTQTPSFSKYETATLRFSSHVRVDCLCYACNIFFPWLDLFPNTFKACRKMQQLKDFKPTAWITVPKVKRICIAKISCFLIMDKRPQRVT